jgi:cytochrome c6
MKKINFIIMFLMIFNFFFIEKSWGGNLEKGKILFLQNCMACHNGGRNVIIPEKNLKKITLQANGMYKIDSIMYQVLNGKNGMPAFGGRLNEDEIENIAEYVIYAAEKSFEF